jgi:HD-like signal output (HDOD) protein
VTRRAEDKLEDELDAERELFGFDHAEVGAALMIKWNLPKELALAIGHHHDPLAMEDPGHLVDALHLADALAYHLLAAGQADGVAPAIQPAVFDRSGLKLEDLGRYMEGLKTEYYGAETFLSLVRTGDF